MGRTRKLLEHFLVNPRETLQRTLNFIVRRYESLKAFFRFRKRKLSWEESKVENRFKQKARAKNTRTQQYPIK